MLLGLLIYIVPIDISLRTIKMETKCEIIITSGYRNRAHNKRVGGAPASFHLQDRARDLILAECDQHEWARSACKYISVIVYSDHVHVDNRKKRICRLGGL